MTIPGGTSRASNTKALLKDKHSHGVGGEQRMKKDGEGGHNWGSAGHELDDELAGQADAQQDAADAIAEGDEHPQGKSFEERARPTATAGSTNTGTLSEEYAEKEGAFIARSTADPKNMDLNEIARTSGAASFPSADVVSSGSHATIAETADQINRGKGTEGGFGGV